MFRGISGLLIVFAVSAVAPAAQAKNLNKIVSHTKQRYNKFFGAAEYVKGGMMLNTTKGQLLGYATAKGYVTAFGPWHNIADVKGIMVQDTKGNFSGYARFFVMGKTLINEVFKGKLGTNWAHYWDWHNFQQVTYFAGTKKFWGVKFGASITGQVGMDYKAKVTLKGLEFYAQPSVKSYGSVDHSVFIGIGHAGASGSLTFIEARVPSTVKAWIKTTSGYLYGFGYKVKVRAVASKFKVWAKIGFGKLSKTFKATLANFVLWHIDSTLINKTGSVSIL